MHSGPIRICMFLTDILPNRIITLCKIRGPWFVLFVLLGLVLPLVFWMSAPTSTAKLRLAVHKLLPSLASLQDRHKGQSGKVGIVGGSLEYTGAPYFAAMSALRCGADLSHVFCMKEAATAIKSYSGDLIVHPLLSGELDSAKNIENWFPALNALVVGPGLGREASVMNTTERIIRSALNSNSNLIVILDGDALWLLAQRPELSDAFTERTVLTPNKAEWTRIEKIDFGKALVIKKGANDEIGKWGECNTPGSVRRVGGQGDLLTGALAAFLVNGKKEEKVDPVLAWGACDVVRSAARLAFAEHQRSAVASDMLAQLGNAINSLYPL